MTNLSGYRVVDLECRTYLPGDAPGRYRGAWQTGCLRYAVDRRRNH